EIIDGGLGQAGDIIRYSLEVTNTGNVTIHDGALFDAKPGLYDVFITCPDAEPVAGVTTCPVLEVGESVTGTALYRITSADVDEGFIENTAGVEGWTAPDRGGDRILRPSNQVIVPTVQAAPALVTTVAGVASGNAGDGQEIVWTVTVRNTGNVTVTGLELFPSLTLDGASFVWPGTPGTLAAGQQVVLSGTTPITQAEVDAGAVILTADATGVPARGPATVTSNEAAATVPTQDSDPELIVTKTADRGNSTRAGEFVTWTYTLTNDGNVTLSGVRLADELPMVGDEVVYDWSGAATEGALAPGETVTATARYALTQADVDRGSVSSPVFGYGTPPRGATVIVQATDGVTIPQTPNALVEKSGEVQGAGEVGDDIVYTFSVENTGNVTLTLVELLDEIPGLSAIALTWPGTPGELAPGAVLNGTATYEISQADVDRGSVENLAFARAKPPVGDVMTWPGSPVTTDVAPARLALDVDKTAVPLTGAAVGSIIDYRISVINTGNVTMAEIDVVDALPGISDLRYTWPRSDETLRPAEQLVVQASHRVTQADVDRGSVTNDVTVTGQGVRAEADGTIEVVESASVTTTTIAEPAAIQVADRGQLAPGETPAAGEEVDWTYVITNIGGVTLTGVTVAEQLAAVGDSYTYGAWPDPERPGVLPPNTSVTVTARSSLTQDQVDAGTALSRVVATGTPPSGADVSAEDEASVPIARTPDMLLDKSAEIIGTGIGQAGDIIRYTLTVTNTGNVTIYDGQLIDQKPGLYSPTITCPGLDPVNGVVSCERVGVGETVVGTAFYQITAADVDAGVIANQASVSANTVAGDTDTRFVRQSQRVEVPTVLPNSLLQTAIAGELAPREDGSTPDGSVGDRITWTITVTNTGNVTVDGLELDNSLGLAGAVFEWPTSAPGTVPAGQSVTVTFTTEITQADVDRGSVASSVTATGDPRRLDEPVRSNTAEDSVPTVAAAPRLVVTDSGAITSGDGRAGDTVTFTYVVENLGNVTLSDVRVADTLPGIGAPVYPGGQPLTLPPNSGPVTITATYVLTQADVDAGSVMSMVTATGTPPVGADATATAQAVVPISERDGLRVVKTGSLASAGENGLNDTIVYEIRIINDGSVTMRNVVLTDALPGLSVPTIVWPDGVAGVIPPGREAVATASYQIAQPDIDRGEVLNTATVTATSARGTDVTAISPQSRVETADADASFTVVKTGAVVAPGTGVAGDTVRFDFRIENTGNVSLADIDLVENLSGVTDPVVTYPAGTAALQPEAIATATATYVLTQADVDAGVVVNSVSASADGGRAGTVETDSNVFEFAPAAPAPAIQAELTGTLADGGTGLVGERIRYTYTLTNIGNVSLTSIGYEALLTGLEDVELIWSGAEGILQPGQTLTIVGDHVITQADVDAGSVRNTLTGSGESPAGTRVTDEAAPVVIPLAQGTTGLDLTKVGSSAAADGAPVGSTVTYTMTLTNTGTLTVRDAQISDPLPGLGEIEYGDWPTAEAGVLPPGESVTATAAYTVRQSDVDRGRILNTATASGATAGGVDVEATSPESDVPTELRQPAVSLTKSVALPAGSPGRAGDVVTYRYVITNTGNVTIVDPIVTDPQARLGEIVIDWGSLEPGSLAPGQSVVATATYTLTQQDVDAGGVQTPAQVDADAVGGGVVSDDAVDAVVIVDTPAISLQKTASVTEAMRVGSTIRFDFVATNTGNLTLDPVVLTDDLAGL
ncbi:MAG: hypothetical protein ABW004_06430, partial [Aeromicrobium sp.]